MRSHRNEQVELYGFDQTYQWIGMQKRGRMQAKERHDAQGMPISIEHAVYINSVRVSTPT